jgi:uncharacterized glyoxalase superfamily protein PhnB
MSAKAKATTATMISCMSYRNVDAAIKWLAKAFGFAEHAVYRDPDGQVMHAELKFGNGMIMLGPEDKGEFGKRFMTMPKGAGGRCTQAVYCIVADVDAHHARAAAAGAEIVMPPKDEDYGGRGYSARDPDGHVWAFGSYDPWTVKPA